MDAAHTRAAREFIDGHGCTSPGAVQMGSPHVERFAPWVASLHDPVWGRFDGPGRRLGPFRVARQSLPDPTRIGPRFVPTDAHDGQSLLVARILAARPI